MEDLNDLVAKGHRPEITYPCPWRYKIIGLDDAGLRGAAAEVLGDTPHALAHSNTSSGGKYRCLNVDVTVDSEDERTRLYEALRRHPAVSMVL